MRLGQLDQAGQIQRIIRLNIMHDNPEIIARIIKLVMDLWAWFLMGLITIVVYFGKRQFNKFDEVVDNYVHQDNHDAAVIALEKKILTCQESVKNDQRELLKEMRAHSLQSARQAEQIIGISRRLDDLTELVRESRR